MNAILTPARDALRWHLRTGLMLAGVGGAALLAVLPAVALISDGASRLRLPDPAPADLGLTFGPHVITPEILRQDHLNELVGALLLVAGCVALVAMIGGVALAVARAVRRGPEIRLRRAVGASRRQLVGAELVHGGLLATTALVLGAAAAMVVIRIVLRSWPGEVAQPAVAPTLAVVAGFAGWFFLMALFPLATRGRVGVESPLPVPLVIPIVQVGLAAAVIATATSLVPAAPAAGHGLGEVRMVHAVTLTGPADWRPLLAAQPGRVALASPGLVTGLGMVDFATTDCGDCYISMLAAPWHVVRAAHHLASADTFTLLGMRLLAGRTFRDAEPGPVAIVSRSLAARHFERGEAVGRHILIGRRPATWHRVIGIVEDRMPDAVGTRTLPRLAVYLNAAQHPATTLDILAADDTPPNLGDLPVAAVRSETAGAAWQAAVLPLDWFAGLFRVQAWLAVLMAAAGVMAVLRYWIGSLTHELGVRRAVGASRPAVARHLVGKVMLVPLIGTAVAWWMGTLLWGTALTAMQASDIGVPATAFRAALLLGALGALATLGPARRLLADTPASLLEE